MEDFVNYIILSFILIMMFTIIGNMNFLTTMYLFKNMFKSFDTVLDISVGNYSFEIYKDLPVPNSDLLNVFGIIYTIAIVITFNILIMNLLIAILANTYNMFETKSLGLYLSKILNSRDELTYDENYGAFLLAMIPLNFVVLPILPMAILTKPSEKMNNMIVIIQYSVLIVIIYIIFLIGSVVMTPFAYLKSVGQKIERLTKATTIREQILAGAELLIFVAFGLGILVLDLVADFYYFWANNFRSNLKKIIIERKKSTLTNDSIRQVKMLCSKYVEKKIKSVYSVDYMKTFRGKLNTTPNL